ncbi:DNA/RNA nuclease SfsA [bacterium]|nr:MAG: DNA/RNA nuclease SfsA [bacterium]
MRFTSPLIRGSFLAREKRFTIHVRLDDGREVAAHTNNTGRMRGCLAPHCPIWLSAAANPARKLPWTLELVETTDETGPGIAAGVLVGVNTARANDLAVEAIGGGMVPGLDPTWQLRREVPYGRQGSRADILLTGPDNRRAWVEVKNVSLVENGHARFPDAPTARGRKHLEELATMVAAGDRAVLLFCVQRGDADSAGPADDIDPDYGVLLRSAMAVGVEVHALGMDVDTAGIVPARLLQVIVANR